MKIQSVSNFNYNHKLSTPTFKSNDEMLEQWQAHCSAVSEKLGQQE